MFTVVRLRNSECAALNGERGVCYTYFQCKKSGGTPSGECATGFGVCCLTHLACGGSTGNNATYLQSPGYRNTFNYAAMCTYTINLRPDVCQLRLDINELDMAPPDITGSCEEDFLRASQDTKFIKLCGRTIDNHFYLDVDHCVSPFVTFTFTTSDVNYNRRWNIRVSQICCDQESLAPSGCGQYYTAPSGVIKGLNHDSDAANDRILSGLNFAVCVRKEIHHCSWLLTSPRESDIKVTLLSALDVEGNPTGDSWKAHVLRPSEENWFGIELWTALFPRLDLPMPASKSSTSLGGMGKPHYGISKGLGHILSTGWEQS
ncbi:uncharacterized protein LOC143027310 [Oratosquilla oratoria]|uniref:uncharacterized protein LOC143027310 n=1 Tax=Oratosquilla oratoria TaxID=337810 RepID=UPI003F7780A9